MSLLKGLWICVGICAVGLGCCIMVMDKDVSQDIGVRRSQNAANTQHADTSEMGV